MKPVTVATLVLLPLISTASAASETLLCVADMSTGFAMENNDWAIARFNVKDVRFVVKPVKPHNRLGYDVNYEVTKIGDSQASHHCNRGNGAEAIACGGLGWGIIVNFRTLRFQEYYGIGYADGRDDGQNTPYLTIGKCAPL
jgi:hypothetical protein